jgi:hypothetical protein
MRTISARKATHREREYLRIIANLTDPSDDACLKNRHQYLRLNNCCVLRPLAVGPVTLAGQVELMAVEKRDSNHMSVVWSCNEWDPLEEVIVGNPLRARFPTPDRSTQLAEFPDHSLQEIPRGPFPRQIIDETEEDLNAFVAVLEELGIAVKRPETWSHEATFSTIHWKAEGFYYDADYLSKSIGSNWIDMNLLSISPNLVVVDQDQTALIRLLEKRGLDVIRLKLRHAKMLGGGFHCITLDIRRTGTLQRYIE